MKNRKLFISILTGLCACLMSATLFTACGETHTHSYTSQITTEATCREKGLTTYTCSCGDTYTEEILALGHDTKTHEAQAPTCTEKGWSEYVTCEREGCDYSTYEEILALKHDIVNHEAQAPTCAEIGWKAYETCQREGCDYTTYEEIPATGKHIWNDGEITTEPTCTETGVKTFTCTVCETATKTENVNALMHDIKVNDSKAPTCTEIGWNAYATCKREGCDYTTYEELPATGVHTWNDGEETTAPTCTKEGETTYTCTVCKTATKTEPIQALPHDHGEEWTYDESNHWHECKCGDKTDESEHIPSAPATATTPQTCTICGYVIQGEAGIVFNTLTTNGNKVNGTVSNATTEFSFLDEITVKGNAQFIVALDKNGMQTVITKKITLQECDNTVYVFETLNGEITNTYTVTIRRRPMYNVTFNEKGGTTVTNQSIEEGFLATAPETTRTGYTFVEWDYDFTTPITKDTEITAIWKANENTKYIVNYYAQNIEDDEYTLFGTEELTGTTDTTATATINEYEHFTYNEKLSTVKGNIDGDGTLVLSVYYTRDSYTIQAGYIIKYFDDYTASEITQTEIWKYGMELTCSVSTWEGYTWIGWYEDIGSDMAQLVTNEQSFAFIVDKNVTYYQCWQANTDTKYTVNYYLQNIDDDEYTLYETEELTGMTDTLATATIKEYEHFTYNEKLSTVSGYIQGDGSLVLSVYYTRNTYTLSINDSSIGSITNAGTYKYGKNISTTITSQKLGYAFLGWYNGEELLSTNTEYTFTMEKDVTAKFDVKAEMLNFEFTSTDTVCEITGAKDGEATEIIVPDYVTSIGDFAFAWCYSLTSVTIGDSVTSIGDSAFYVCESLISVTIPDSVASIGDSAFFACHSLISVTIPDSVASIGDSAFYDCNSLTSVTIGKSVTSIGDSAFFYCNSLTSITIPDSVTSIGFSAFRDCFNLTEMTLPFVGASKDETNNTHFGYIFGATSYDYNESCIPYHLNKVTITSIATISSYAFFGCKNLKSITIPDSVTSIGSYAFYYCTNLTNITIPDSVIYIDSWAFANCSSLASVTIGDSVTSINPDAFYYCRSLMSVLIGNNVTFIGSDAFRYCSKLVEVVNKSTYITITKGSEDNGYVGCYALAVFNSGEAYINKFSNDNGYIVYTDGEEKILVSYTGTKTDLILPSYITKINQYAFEDCSSLTSVAILDSVTSIGYQAFSDCSSLASVTIGDSVTSIGEWAFNGCDSLTSVYYKGTASDWSKISIDYYNSDLTSATRYYYSESEPALNADGTAYDGNYWRYAADGITPVIWIYNSEN